MLIFMIVDEAADRGLGPEIVFQLIPYILPEALMYAMPATALFSACVVFGRMAADNEMIAIQAMGLHKFVIIAPALALAFLLSIFAVWINDISFAWSYWGIERVVLESSDKIVYGVLKKEGSFSTPKFSIEVQGVDGRKLIGPIITFSTPKHEQIRAVAHQAVITTHPETHSLELTMTRGSASYEGKGEFSFDAEHTEKIPLKTPEEIAKKVGNPTHLYLSQIGSEVKKQAIEVEELEQSHAIRALSQMITGDMVGLTNPDWDIRAEALEDSEKRLRRLKLVPHRRWANGFSCLAFAVIGIPVALRLKTANYAATFGICFIPILAIYYPLFMFGLDGAKSGNLPPHAAWLGNIACISIGTILMFREFKR